MIKIYELGKVMNINFESKETADKLKFSLFPYTYSQIVLTALLIFSIFLSLGILLEFIFSAQVLLITFLFFGLIVMAILYIYPTSIYYQLKIMEYKKEMLNSIMRFSTYLAMNTNMEYAVKNSIDYTKGILEVQLKDILIKLERKEFKDIGEAFKEYSLIWNIHSPEFVDSLKLLEVASMSSGVEAERIMNDAIDQIILSYNIQQKRNSEELSEKISKLITVGIMLPIMFLMLVPLVSVFMPGVMSASVLFFIFDIFFPAFLLISALNFSAKRIQFSNIDIESSNEYKKPTYILYLTGAIIFLIFFIPSISYMIINDPANIDFDSFVFSVIFFVWLMPAGIAASIYVMSTIYVKQNNDLWKRYNQIEDDVPHLLNYFSTYLSLNVPMENIFEEITTDYERHGFKDHPTVKLLHKVTFKLYHLKTNLKTFIKHDLPKISSVNSLNEILEQIVSFSEFSLNEAAKAARKIRSQRVDLIKLNDYILTLLNAPISLISSTVSMLAPLLSALAIIMSLFIVTFIKFLTKQLEQIANLGNTGASAVKIDLIDINSIVSPVYLELIIGFYIVEIILILALLKSNITKGYNIFSIIKSIKSSQIGFFIFTVCLFGGYFVFKIMFSTSIGVNLN